MSNARAAKSSEYMMWAKTASSARFNLANSGLANLKLTELDVQLEEIEITGDSGYGYEPLLAAIAARLNVRPENIVTAMGTSFANHLAMAALIQPGDEVLIEHPTYEPLLSLARYLGAEVKRFPRHGENGFQILPEEVEGNVNSQTRLIVITNLHNPSGVLTSETTMNHLLTIARAVNARVLVDEVYLETLFESRPRTAFHLGPEFVVTSSLTKAFGLSGLRCGWIVAEPALAREMWLLNDLFASTPVHAGERLSLVAFRRLEEIGKQAQALLETNRARVNQFLDSRADLETVRAEFGTTVFPRLIGGPADEFCRLLRKKYETAVVPGRFFEMPDHFRLGLTENSETVAAGLQRLGLALDEFGRHQGTAY